MAAITPPEWGTADYFDHLIPRDEFLSFARPGDTMLLHATGTDTRSCAVTNVRSGLGTEVVCYAGNGEDIIIDATGPAGDIELTGAAMQRWRASL